MHHGAQAYARTAQQTASPRERDAQILLRAAARFAAAQSATPFDVVGAREAATLNRKIWTVFLSAASRDDNPLDAATKQNIKKIALFAMNRSLEVEVDPKPDLLNALITINRNVAEGLRG
ncbi:flagellar biosynthesis regulator FlaF [Hansschlegelia quercus]|uniref:Flagellar biosynthesis regulatory protein FlaF n=1 Tax=Hansschlegelia quercus TaxID=2528245 RepID=A0A4Q9GL70_9HYPH|nr:flagellar biosynthesis regulator FlaF [Hansschlegelia quercus]TBN55073.1 flagellar biosynthesis regulatory protein FlaF [Hansschlegelia quercus]